MPVNCCIFAMSYIDCATQPACRIISASSDVTQPPPLTSACVHASLASHEAEPPAASRSAIAASWLRSPRNIHWSKELFGSLYWFDSLISSFDVNFHFIKFYIEFPKYIQSAKNEWDVIVFRKNAPDWYPFPGKF